MVQSSSKSPELLARYCDSLLKKSSKNPEEAELEDTLNQVVSRRTKMVLSCHHITHIRPSFSHQLWSDSSQTDGVIQRNPTCSYEYRLGFIYLWVVNIKPATDLSHRDVDRRRTMFFLRTPRLNFPFTSFSRWWCLSTSRTKTCSRSFMRKCWPSAWCTRTAPATMPRPAWSPNWRFDQLALKPALNGLAAEQHSRVRMFLAVWFESVFCSYSKRAASSTRPSCSACSRTSASAKTWTSSSRSTSQTRSL